MNIELIAANRTVRISDCHDTAEGCADLALGLWVQTEPEKEELGGGIGFTTEKEYRPTGFVDVSLDQMEIR